MSAKEFSAAFLQSLVIFSILFFGLSTYYKIQASRRQGNMTACKSNLKNIGTAMEMYSTDWSGSYPSNLSILTPNYLKSLPICPTTESPPYYLTCGPGAPFNPENYDQYYLLECTGTNHLPVSIPANYPKYTGITGLMER